MIPYPQPLAQDSPARKPRGAVRHILLLLLSLQWRRCKDIDGVKFELAVHAC